MVEIEGENIVNDTASTDAVQNDIPTILFKQADNLSTYSLRGIWTKTTLSEIENNVAALINEISNNEAPQKIIIDLRKIKKIDTSGTYLVTKILRIKNKNKDIQYLTSDDATKNLLEKILSYNNQKQTTEIEYNNLEAFGKKVADASVNFYSELISTLSFVGQTLVCFIKAIFTPHHIRWTPTFAIAESAGLNAIPIVSTLMFFIGAVISFMGAQTLQSFGATIYAVDLLGISVLREFAVLITAIILAGRSDSAFTAQIGSMKMTQEVDAMATIGLDPMEMLVIPRVISLLIMTPILVFFAILAGIAGGAVVALLSLDISPSMFLTRLQSVGVTHFWCGMAKAPIFAFIIAIIGCRQGLMVGNDVISLGKNTTAAVVQAIFMVIVVDAIFALIYNELEI